MERRLGLRQALRRGVAILLAPLTLLRRNEVRLFLTSFAILFVELLLIRWIPANVKYIGFFSNFLLIAIFLGIGLGILLGRKRLEPACRRPSPCCSRASSLVRPVLQAQRADQVVRRAVLRPRREPRGGRQLPDPAAHRRARRRRSWRRSHCRLGRCSRACRRSRRTPSTSPARSRASPASRSCRRWAPTRSCGSRSA